MIPVLTKIAVSLLFQLVTESFVKRFVVHSLQWAAKRTDNEVDDKLVQDVKQAWAVED